MYKSIVKQRRYYIEPQHLNWADEILWGGNIKKEDIIKYDFHSFHRNPYSGEMLSLSYENLIAKNNVERDIITIWEGDSPRKYRKGDRLLLDDTIHNITDVINNIDGSIIYYIEDAYDNSPNYDELLIECERKVDETKERISRNKLNRLDEDSSYESEITKESSFWSKLKAKLGFS